MATTETPKRAVGTPADAQRLLQLGTGLMYAAALHPIAKLRIADVLAEGPRTVEQLAQETGSSPDALYRVLRFLSSAGVFTEAPQRTFALTPVSEFLRSGVPGSARDMILWMGNEFHFKVWSQLSYSIQTGRPAVENVYGKPCFDAIFGDPEIAYDFNTAMSCLSRMIA